MILPWNRKEIYVGTSMEQFCKARDQLSARGIQYHYRTVSNGSSGRHAVAVGLRQEYSILYYLYVDQRDFDAARTVIRL